METSVVIPVQECRAFLDRRRQRREARVLHVCRRIKRKRFHATFIIVGDRIDILDLQMERNRLDIRRQSGVSHRNRELVVAGRIAGPRKNTNTGFSIAGDSGRKLRLDCAERIGRNTARRLDRMIEVRALGDAAVVRRSHRYGIRIADRQREREVGRARIAVRHRDIELVIARRRRTTRKNARRRKREPCRNRGVRRIEDVRRFAFGDVRRGRKRPALLLSSQRRTQRSRLLGHRKRPGYADILVS